MTLSRFFGTSKVCQWGSYVRETQTIDLVVRLMGLIEAFLWGF